MVSLRTWRARDGFTLIELLVVMAIIALLLSIVTPRYFHSLARSKEAVLRENLRTTREAIDRFYGDLGRYPDSLQELVDRHYLRSLPVDPLTGSADGWTIVPPPAGADKGAVYDLRSSAPGRAADGTPYSQW
jgi:general secretion pathway protein G